MTAGIERQLIPWSVPQLAKEGVDDNDGTSNALFEFFNDYKCKKLLNWANFYLCVALIFNLFFLNFFTISPHRIKYLK